jgi:hypothetical protein
MAIGTGNDPDEVLAALDLRIRRTGCVEINTQHNAR